MLPIPTSGSASSTAAATASLGRRRRARASRVDSEPSTAIRCFALVQGIAAMKANAAIPWIHQLARRTAAAPASSMPKPRKIWASTQPTGDQGPQAG